MSNNQKKIDDNDPEWVLKICNFVDAWNCAPPSIFGKSMGEGIIIVHPDTGWTTHPELWDDRTIENGKLQDDRYLTKLSKNFMKPRESAVDTLSKSVLRVITADDMNIKGPIQPDPIVMPRIFNHPSHGTATASVMMSKRGPPSFDQFSDYPVISKYVSGAAPLSKVIPLKVCDTVVLSAQSCNALAKSIQYSIHLSKTSASLRKSGSSIGVISISLGIKDSWANKHHLKSALKAAKKEGIIVIASGGQGQGPKSARWVGPAYPGTDPNVISVTACDKNYNVWNRASLGKSIDLTAPGEKVWKADAESQGAQLPNKYSVCQSNGTSYSAPLVAAACALWQAFHNREYLLDKYGSELIFDVFKKCLLDSCNDLEGTWRINNPFAGAGVLDAKALLLYPLPKMSDM